MIRFIFIWLISVIQIVAILGQDGINPNGYNVLYYPNGSVLSEGYMKDGKPEGYWKTYYTTGILKSEGNRKNFLLDSVWIFYNSTGDTLKKINYLLGKKNGYSYEYYTDRSKPEFIGKHKSKELMVNDSKEGVSYYYYISGKLHEEVNYLNNKPDGLSIEYAENDGRIITIKRYSKGNLIEREKINRFNAEGLKDGEWREFYDGIKVKTEAQYKNGKLDGYYKEYDQYGKLLLTLLYDDGRLVEEIKESSSEVVIMEIKSEDGNFTERGPYIDGTPVGIHKTLDNNGDIVDSKIYDDNGVLLSKGVIDKEGNRQGDWLDYYRGGTVRAAGQYLNNLREGKWQFYFENGNIEQTGSYKQGKQSGLWKWFYNTGELWIEEEFYNGLLEGIYTEYDPEGNILVEGEYIEGEKEGNWTISINDFVAKGKYITGLEDGKWKYFYNDGSVMFEGNYIQGNAEGKHKYYYPDGTLKEEQFYSSGIPDKLWKKYDPEGNIIVTITYENGKEYRINGVKVDLPDDNTVIIK
jgi:antitoxin component YwqK of YwqJK toxin-antitoxin module